MPGSKVGVPPHKPILYMKANTESLGPSNCGSGETGPEAKPSKIIPSQGTSPFRFWKPGCKPKKQVQTLLELWEGKTSVIFGFQVNQGPMGFLRLRKEGQHRMSFKMDREEYAQHYGPTVGDSVRLVRYQSFCSH
ncbi:Urease [Streptococcus thermophilus CNCM I-1630]|nr:Urease [Streptococcus thermophilus CNCM I-1630]